MNESDHNLNSAHRGNTGSAQGCPAPQRLAQLSANRIWPWQRRAVVNHLAHCHHCSDEYQVLLRARGGLESALARHLPEAELARPRWGMALASLVAVAALVVVMVPRTGDVTDLAQNDQAPIERPIFGGEFEAVELAGVNDSLFSGDFDNGTQTTESKVFTDEFGG